MIRSVQLALLLVSLVAAAAHAESFYSIDAASGDLVEIDSSDGSVQVIGPIGFTVSNTDLAITEDGRLFALNSTGGSGASGSSTLVQINPDTGASVSTVAVSGPDLGQGLPADGLAAAGNALKMAVCRQADARSDELGDLAANGTLSSLVALTPGPADADGFGGNLIDGFFAIDVITATSMAIIYEVQIDTGILSPVASYSTGTLDGIDLDVAGAKLFVLDRAQGAIHRLSLGGNIEATIPLQRVGTYWGLARTTTQTVPALPPSALGLLAAVFFGLGGVVLARYHQPE